jgi:HK97 family phage prohead protease
VSVMETRVYETSVELRDVTATGRGPYTYLEGMAVPYDKWQDINDWMAERHAGGSFKRSTRDRSGHHAPLLLWHDNQQFPIGHAEAWQHTPDGMFGVWKLNETDNAQQAAKLAKAGDLTGLSVGFQDAVSPDVDEDAAGKLWVTRMESRLLEVSVTPTPAFADAAVTMVRTATRRPAPPEREVDAWRRLVETLRSGH